MYTLWYTCFAIPWWDELLKSWFLFTASWRPKHAQSHLLLRMLVATAACQARLAFKIVVQTIIVIWLPLSWSISLILSLSNKVVQFVVFYVSRRLWETQFVVFYVSKSSERLNLSYFTCLEGSGRLNLSYFTCLESSKRLNLSYFTCLEGSRGLNLSYFAWLEGSGGLVSRQAWKCWPFAPF